MDWRRQTGHLRTEEDLQVLYASKKTYKTSIDRWRPTSLLLWAEEDHQVFYRPVDSMGFNGSKNTYWCSLDRIRTSGLLWTKEDLLWTKEDQQIFYGLKKTFRSLLNRIRPSGLQRTKQDLPLFYTPKKTYRFPIDFQTYKSCVGRKWYLSLIWAQY